MCFGQSKNTKESKKSKEIDDAIKLDRKKLTLKLLLLGTGDSGKSTFAKQMTIIHNNGFSEDKLMQNVPLLRSNVLDSIKILVSACRDWKIEIPGDLQSAVDEIMATTQLSDIIAQHTLQLWKSAPIQKAFEQRNRIQLPGGASATQYYMENAPRIAQPDFKPNQDDLLRVKIRTTGILETVFTVNGTEFVMVDVGGQRSERKKWLQCFNDVSATIYLVALNEYDMLMEEDNCTNRMEESLKLFQKLSGSQWLKDTPVILFLNKSDLFEEKIKTRPLNKFFQDYDDFVNGLPTEKQGLSEFEASCEYFKIQYAQVFNGTRLYTFYTCALDSGNCERVFAAVRDAVMTAMFKNNF